METPSSAYAKRHELSDAVDRYMQHLLVDRRLSPHTLDGYGRDLAQMVGFLRESEQCAVVSDVDRRAIERWSQALSAQGLEASSQSRMLSAARQFFLFWQHEGLIKRSPCSDVVGPKVRRFLPPRMAHNDADRLMMYAAHKIELAEDAKTAVVRHLALRDQAVLEILYGCGLRASELCGLELESIDLRGKRLRPWGKGGRERIVPMGDKAINALTLYLKEARPMLVQKERGKKPCQAVFIGRRGQPMTRMGLYKRVRRLAEEAGLAKGISPHSLRHAFATHLLQGGASLLAVQEMLGHADVSTTEVYTQVVDDTLHQTVALHHPLGAQAVRARARPKSPQKNKSENKK